MPCRGGFMIIRRHGSKETRVIDFRETAPNHAVSSTNSHVIFIPLLFLYFLAQTNYCRLY